MKLPSPEKQPDHRAVEQNPTDWQKLQDQHHWQTPDWATVKKQQNVNKNESHRAIVKDPVPRPMLKKMSVTAATAGGKGTNGASFGGDKVPSAVTTNIQDAEAEIAEMERLIEQATQKKIALLAAAKEAEEQERQKHTVNETALEKARREAKEREEARWRATLQERNARDKERREQARLNALCNNNKTRDDASWQQTSPTRSKHACHGDQGREEPTTPTLHAVEEKQLQQQQQQSPNQPNSRCQQHTVKQQQQQQQSEHENEVEYEDEEIEEEEYYEEIEDEYEDEEVLDDDDDGELNNHNEETAVELQRQIDDLRRQLAVVST